MRLTVKLLPPFDKRGLPGEEFMVIDRDEISILQFAEFLNKAWRERLAYPLVDESGLPLAGFLVNGRHATPGTSLCDGDRVTVFPYIGGG